jgi:hypothetical protein
MAHKTSLNGVRRPTYGILWDKLRNKIVSGAKSEGKVEILGRQIKTLERELKLVRSDTDFHEKLDRFLESVSMGIRNVKTAKQPGTKPKWMESKRAGKSLAGVPILFCSDWHFDEMVDPLQIERKNKYDHDIAVTRANRLFETAGNLLFTHLSGAYYDAIVIALGGDMVSGMIHDELRRTNCDSISETVITLSSLLAKLIRQMAAEFPEVYVPCVVGNHGRMDRKPQAKGFVKDNFEYIVYCNIRALLADLPNVTVDVSTSPDIQFGVYGWDYRMTHGNQAKGGSGVGGFWPSLHKLDMRKHKLYSYDYLMLGHFHQRGQMSHIIVNGSLKGYDEYANSCAFDFQPAEQAMWITHPDMGITFDMPIIVQDVYRSKDRRDVPISPTMHPDSDYSDEAEEHADKLVEKEAAIRDRMAKTQER